MRFPLVWRSTMEAALEAQLGRHNALLGEKEHRIVRYEAEHRRLAALHAETDNCRIEAGATAVRLMAELDRIREHFEATCKAKDEAYRIVAAERDGLRVNLDHSDWLNEDLEARLSCLGILPPLDWAAPLPPWLSTVVTADVHGVCGEVGGMGGDPNGDDPRYNMSLSFGLRG